MFPERGFFIQCIFEVCKNLTLGDAEFMCYYSVWRYGEYLGLGLGASSFLKRKEGGFRSKNTDDMSLYLASCGAEGVTVEEISEAEAMKEFIMLGLRLEEGLNKEDFHDFFSVDFMGLYGEKVKKLGKMLVVSTEKVAIAPEYFYVSNTIIEEIIY